MGKTYIKANGETFPIPIAPRRIEVRNSMEGRISYVAFAGKRKYPTGKSGK